MMRDNPVSFKGGDRAFKDLRMSHNYTERNIWEGFDAKKAAPPPVVHEPSFCERLSKNLLSCLTPPCLSHITYNDCVNWSGNWVVLALSTFVVFFLPWLPMALENSRSCKEFAINGDPFGKIDVNIDAQFNQYLMNFDMDLVMRSRREYESILYNLDVFETPLGRYTGDKDRLDFEDLDPLCDSISANNTVTEVQDGPVHFCVRPENQRILGAPVNKNGRKARFYILSPQIPDLEIEVTVFSEGREKLFPTVVFEFISLPENSSISLGTEVRFSSGRSKRYIRRSNYDLGKVIVISNVTDEDTGEIVEVLEETRGVAWLGAATPILGVGGYENRFGIDQIPSDFSDDGKFHRLCTISRVLEEELDPDDLPSDAVEFIREVLLSTDTGAKLGYHVRAATLFKDETSKNLVFKMAFIMIIMTIIVSATLVALEESG